MLFWNTRISLTLFSLAIFLTAGVAKVTPEEVDSAVEVGGGAGVDAGGGGGSVSAADVSCVSCSGCSRDSPPE